jgi:6-phosphogluconate dehydrogenase
MGANMVQRLIKAGHEVVVWDRSEEAVKDLASKGAIAAADQKDLVSKLTSPKAVWMMIPAAYVDDTIATFAPLLGKGDILIDGGNSSTRTISVVRRNWPVKALNMWMSAPLAESGGWNAAIAR